MEKQNKTKRTGFPLINLEAKSCAVCSLFTSPPLSRERTEGGVASESLIQERKKEVLLPPHPVPWAQELVRMIFGQVCKR